MIKSAKRISIIGGNGSGKTTLGDNLSNILNLPVYHLDAIQYFENWEKRDNQDRDRIILEKTKEDKWILDGSYKSTLAERLNCSDVIIFLDYSSIAHLKGVISRFLKHPNQEKKEIPGCKERLSFDFLKFVWNWRKNKRDIILENLEKIDNSKVLIFKNRNSLNKWFYNEFNKKMNVD